MTIQEALDRTDRMKPNQIEPEEKIHWLNGLDQMIWNEIFTRHIIPEEESETTVTTADGWWGDPLSPQPISEKPTYIINGTPGVDDGTPAKPAYTNETSTDTKLLVESPYDDMYPLYLAAKIDLVNQEFDLYHNNMALYNNMYQTYVDYVHRTYPLRVRRTRWKL